MIEQVVIILSTFGFTVYAARELSLQEYRAISLAQYFFTFWCIFNSLIERYYSSKVKQDIHVDETLGSAYITQLLSSAFVEGLCIYSVCLTMVMIR